MSAYDDLIGNILIGWAITVLAITGLYCWVGERRNRGRETCSRCGRYAHVAVDARRPYCSIACHDRAVCEDIAREERARENH